MTKLRVEMGFGSGPASPSIGWTDISPYLDGVEIDRGRSYELDRVETGTATLTLDNSDGRFTPGKRWAGPDFAAPFDQPSGLDRFSFGWTPNDAQHDPASLTYEGYNDGCARMIVPAGLTWGRAITREARAIPARGRDKMRGSATFLPGGPTADVSVGLLWYQGTSYLSTDATRQVLNVSAGWQTLTIDAIPPAAADSYRLAVYLYGGTSTASAYFDDVQGLGIAPYWPNVEAGTPVHIQVAGDIDTTYEDAYYGFVEKWEAPVTGRDTDTVTVRCVDAFTLLSHVDLPTFYRLRVLNALPTHYWPLDEPAGGDGKAYGLTPATPTLAKVNGSGGAAGLGTFGLDGVIASADGGSTSYGYVVKTDATGNPVPSTATYLRSSTVPVTGSTAFTLEFWVNITNDTQPGVLFEWESTTVLLKVFRSGTSSGPALWTFRADDKVIPSRSIKLEWTETMSTLDRVHVALVGVGATTFKAFVQGTMRSSGTFAQTSLGYSNSTGTIAVGGTAVTSAGPYTSMRLGHVAVYEGALADAEILAHYNIGREAFTQRESQYIGDILKYAGITYYDVPAGDSALAPPGWDNGANALEQALDIAAYANGLFYSSRAGNLTFRPRSVRDTAAVVARFDCEGPTSPVPGLTFATDLDRVYTRFEGHRGESWRVATTQNAARDKIGLRVMDIDRPFGTFVELTNCVNWYAQNYYKDRVRCDEVSFDAHVSPELAYILKTLEVNTKIQLDRLPNTSPESSMTFFVEGIRHQIEALGGVTSWVVTLNISPGNLTPAWVR